MEQQSAARGRPLAPRYSGYSQVVHQKWPRQAHYDNHGARRTTVCSTAARLAGAPGDTAANGAASRGAEDNGLARLCLL